MKKSAMSMVPPPPTTTTICGDHKVVTDSDMAEAADHLMQLSSEDRSNGVSSSISAKSCVNNNTKSLESPAGKDLFGGVSSPEEITSRKIEEIFGKDDVDHVERQRPEKKRRYRSIASIYKETSFINNVRYESERRLPERKQKYRSLASIYKETSPVVDMRYEKKAKY